MKKYILCMVLLSVLLSAQIASAATDYWFNDWNGNPILYLTLPDSWNGEWEDYDGVYFLNAMPRDESLVMMSWALYDVRGMGPGFDSIDVFLNEIVYDLRESDRHSERVNEIPYEYKNGTAKLRDDGMEVAILLMVIAPESDIVVNLVYIGAAEDHERHAKEWEQIYYSIRERR